MGYEKHSAYRVNTIYLFQTNISQPLKGGLVAKGLVTIMLKCVRSQVQLLPGVNNPEVATLTSCQGRGRALPGLSLCGEQ